MTISTASRDLVIAHARDASPRECCGLLIGSGAAVVEIVPAHNIAEAPTRFLIDPADHIAGRRHARERGLEVLGFYHSHVYAPASPSESDVAGAGAYPDSVHLIVSLARDEAETRLFRIDGGVVAEVPLLAVS